MEWLPLAQAALTVKLMPRRWKMLLRFMFTVEFIDWKISPEPSRAESCFSFMMFAASMTGAADESLPKMMPTSFCTRKSSSMPACSKASFEAMNAYSASSDMPTRRRRCSSPFSCGRSTMPVSAD